MLAGFAIRGMALAVLVAGLAFAHVDGTFAADPGDPGQVCQPRPGTYIYEVRHDGGPLGLLKIDVSYEQASLKVRTELDLKLQLMALLPSLEYRHRSEESWRDGRLERFDGNTLSAGKSYGASIRNGRNGTLMISRKGRPKHRPMTAPLMTSAFWCARVVLPGLLLNPLKGKNKSYRAQYIGPEPLRLGARELMAERYAIRQKGRDGALWYGPDGILAKARFESEFDTTLTFVRRQTTPAH